jgi:hypothetical protein
MSLGLIKRDRVIALVEVLAQQPEMRPAPQVERAADREAAI